jgi:tight adherence protein C
MASDLMLYATLAMAGVAAAMFTYLVMTAVPSEEIVGAGGGRRAAIENPAMRLVLPVARMLAPLHAKAIDTQSGRDLERLLKKAGRPFGMTVAEFLCLRYVGASVGAVLGYMVSTQISGGADLFYIVPLTIFGFLYPGMRLKAVAQLRQRRIFRDMPYVIDLLTLSTEAGLDFSSAMATVVEKGPSGPLVEEFRVAHQEVTLGKTRADSLRAMADRIDLTELTSFVLALLQAEQLGASVAKTLRVMGEQMRVKRWALAEETAGKVPVKLMAPLVACIFPASFIVLFVPIYLRAQATGGL